MNERLFEQLSESLKNHQEVALITVTDHPEAQVIGAKSLLLANGNMIHEVDYPESFLNKITEHCLPLLRKQTTKTIDFPWEFGKAELFVEVFPPPPHLIVAGAGHVSEPVAEIGTMAGFDVTVIDDRPEYANREHFPDVNEVVCQSYLDYFRNVPITPQTYIVLLTRGHKFDVISLQELLARKEQPAYIGMIGSRRRISGVFEQLRSEFTDHNFENVYSPVGLDIGAQTPAEIAVSIIAEILKVKNSGSGRSLKENISSYSKLRFHRRDRK